MMTNTGIHILRLLKVGMAIDIPADSYDVLGPLETGFLEVQVHHKPGFRDASHLTWSPVDVRMLAPV